jgi:hypothetical protein
MDSLVHNPFHNRNVLSRIHRKHSFVIFFADISTQLLDLNRTIAASSNIHWVGHALSIALALAGLILPQEQRNQDKPRIKLSKSS